MNVSNTRRSVKRVESRKSISSIVKIKIYIGISNIQPLEHRIKSLGNKHHGRNNRRIIEILACSI